MTNFPVTKTPMSSTQDVATKMNKVKSYIENNNDLTAFIRFSVNNFSFDTSSPETKNHFAVSMKNQKTGVGQGNKFDIKIVFNPEFSPEGFNINEFEEALAYLGDAYKAANNRNECTLTYGYLNTNDLVSPTYVGMLLSYEVTANKQIVEYTLKGVAGEEQATNITINWYPMYKELKQPTAAKLNTLTGELRTDSINALFGDKTAEQDYENKKEELQKILSNYKYEITANPFTALRCFVNEYNNYALEVRNKSSNIESVTVFNIVDKTTKDSSGCESELQLVSINPCVNQTATEYIEYLIGLFQKKTSSNDIDAAIKQFINSNEMPDRFVFEYRYNAEKTKAANYTSKVIDIVISRISNEADNYCYELENYTATNRMLLDYSLNYNGTVALAAKNNLSDATEDLTSKIYIDSSGRLMQKAVITKHMFTEGALTEVVTKESNRWLDNISCSNNCTATTVGIPFEIPTGTVFNITSYIGSIPHHTSGRCYVVNSVDVIENNKFTTQYTLVRLPGRSNKL